MAVSLRERARNPNDPLWRTSFYVAIAVALAAIIALIVAIAIK